MSNPFDNIKARLDKNTSTGSTSGVGSNSGFNARLSKVTQQYNEQTSIFTSVYGDVKASAEAEVKAVNDRLKKQQRTQAIIGAISAAATLAPQALSLISSIKSCKSASSDSKLTPQQKQTQIQEYTQKITDAEKQVSAYTTDISKLEGEIATARTTKEEQGKVSIAKQKEIDDAKGAKYKLTESMKNETDETLVSLNNDIKTQNTNKTQGQADLSKAQAMPDMVQQKKVVNGQVQIVQVKNTAKEKAVEAAKKKISDAENAIKRLEQQKTDRKAEIQKDIDAKETERKAAVDAKRQADEAVAQADKDIADKDKSMKDKIAAKTKLENEVTQLKTALEELKKSAGTTQTSTTQTQTAQVTQQRQQTAQAEDPAKKKQS